MSKKAILFPAFVRGYSGMEGTFVKSTFPGFKSRLEIASEITGTDLTLFDFETNNFQDDELRSQYISYIFSCELADLINHSSLEFDFTAGYSMGIYAMFFYTGSISWENGLMIIKKAYESVSESIPPNIFGMGNIIGLNLIDINSIMKDEEAEIININGSHNFVISGTLTCLHNIIEKAKIEGAIHARMLPVGCPYHSKFIRESVVGFRNFIHDLEIKDPGIPVISGIDQREIKDIQGIRRELINNLVTALNWQDTILKLHSKGTGIFYECGAGDSLTKLNKFILADQKTFKFYQLEKLQLS